MLNTFLVLLGMQNSSLTNKNETTSRKVYLHVYSGAVLFLFTYFDFGKAHIKVCARIGIGTV